MTEFAEAESSVMRNAWRLDSENRELRAELALVRRERDRRGVALSELSRFELAAFSSAESAEQAVRIIAANALSQPAAERESLPLIARRDWMPEWANYVAWDGDGGCWLYKRQPSMDRDEWWEDYLPDEKDVEQDTYSRADQLGRMHVGDWRESLHRVVDTDEHGLPVIPRTADMPEGAQYRGWTERTRDWTYYVCFIEKHAHNRFEHIEDYNERGHEGRR